MHEAGFLMQAFVFLAAAVIAVPIAARLGLGSVLGYLCAGAVIGPFALGLIGEALVCAGSDWGGTRLRWI